MRLPIAPHTLALLILAAAAVPASAQGPATDTTTLRASSPKVAERIPERWGADEALVVGQLAGTWDFGFATMGGENLRTSLGVKGGGGRVRDGLYRGVVLFTRDAGNVTFSSARVEIGSMFRHLAIDRKFATKPGQITVLGLMHFQKDASRREGYRLVAFDNTAETIDYLRRTYPQLLAAREAPAVELAPGDYLPMEKLVELRTAYAQREARQAKRQGQFWVAAPAGTIAEVKVAGESVQVLRFLAPVTYHEPMMNRWDADGTLTFSSTTHRWRVVDGTVEQLPPPEKSARK